MGDSFRVDVTHVSAIRGYSLCSYPRLLSGDRFAVIRQRTTAQHECFYLFLLFLSVLLKPSFPIAYFLLCQFLSCRGRPRAGPMPRQGAMSLPKVGMSAQPPPCRDKRMSRRRRLRPRLLPFQGDDNPVIIPRALPWADCLLAFQAVLP